MIAALSLLLLSDVYLQSAEFSDPNATQVGYGMGVAVDGDWMAVGNPADNVSGAGTENGSVDMYRFDGRGWSLFETITHSSDTQGDHFGWRLELKGDRLFVAARHFDFQAPGDDLGAVFVFEHSAAGWSETARLNPSLNGGTYFGERISAGDGWVAVTSPASQNGYDEVFIFQEPYTTTGASSQPLFQAPQALPAGMPACIAAKEDRLAIGAPYADQVYIFERAGSSGWASTSTLTGDGIGDSVVWMGDRLLSGAITRDLNKGAVVVFEPPFTTEVASFSGNLEPGFRWFGWKLAAAGNSVLVSSINQFSFTNEVARFDRIEGYGWVKRGVYSPFGLGFGSTMDASPDHIAITARYEDLGTVGAYHNADHYETFCTSTPNSSQQRARIDAIGSCSVAGDGLTLVVSGLPSTGTAVFFAGTGATQLPFANGFICLTGPFTRYPLSASQSGLASRRVDWLQAPGSTMYFQTWFPDPLAGGAGVNLSDGIAIEILP